jgi:thiamine biosynthesis lipoprotein
MPRSNFPRFGWPKKQTQPGSTPAPPLLPGWQRLEEPLMGTEVSVELWHEDPAAGLAAAHAVMAEYHRINELMSTYREDSEISALNREAGQHPFAASQELFDLVARSLELGRMSEGCFDITYDSVGFLYDLRAGVVPDDEAVRGRLPLINYRAVEMDPQRRTVFFRQPGMRINLGGIAKGYAVERGAAILRRHGVHHALLNAGGDSRVVGDRRGQPWMIGVRDPRARDAVIARLPLVDEAISTAGDYERFFERDGVRYHHILNPVTGAPSCGIRSVTVIGPDGTLTDGLDTAIFVMGVAKGMALIASLPQYEAVIVDDQGQLYYSDGLLSPAR